MDALYAGKHYDAFIKKCTFNYCIISNIVFVPCSQYFIAFKEDLENMEIINPPGIPVNTKRLPPNKKRLKMKLALDPPPPLTMPHMLLLSSTLPI